MTHGGGAVRRPGPAPARSGRPAAATPAYPSPAPGSLPRKASQRAAGLATHRGRGINVSRLDRGMTIWIERRPFRGVSPPIRQITQQTDMADLYDSPARRRSGNGVLCSGLSRAGRSSAPRESPEGVPVPAVPIGPRALRDRYALQGGDALLSMPLWSSPIAQPRKLTLVGTRLERPNRCSGKKNGGHLMARMVGKLPLFYR